MRRLAIALVLAGCGGARADGRWEGTVETLPNGARRVTNPAQGIWRDGSGWRLVPELKLGSVEGEGAAVFASVSGLEVDDAGRIYVLDRTANELRIFSPDGTHVRSVGRSGAGPGEYSNANGLVWLSADTLLVVDQRGARYTLLTRDGDYIRSVRRWLGFYGWVFSGAYHDARIYESFSVGDELNPRPAMLGTSLRVGELAEATGIAPTSEAGAVSTEAAIDTLLLPVTAGPRFEAFSVRTARGGMGMSVPFAPKSAYHMDGEGAIWHGHGSEFRIIRSSLDGDTIMEIVLHAEPVPVTSAELAEWETGNTVKQFREMGGRLDMDRIPKQKPFFDALYVDPDRYLWVSVPAGAMEGVIFAVFDPNGQYLGRLQADISRDAYVQPVVRNGRLYVVGRDELGVQSVYVFAIEK